MGMVAVLLSPRAMVYKLQLSIYDSYICKKENIKAVNASGKLFLYFRLSAE